MDLTRHRQAGILSFMRRHPKSVVTTGDVASWLGITTMDADAHLEILQEQGKVSKLYVRERTGDGDLRHIGWMLTLAGHEEGDGHAAAEEATRVS